MSKEETANKVEARTPRGLADREAGELAVKTGTDGQPAIRSRIDAIERMDAEGRNGAAGSDEGDLGPLGVAHVMLLCGPNAASICSGDRPARKIDAADASARQRFEFRSANRRCR